MHSISRYVTTGLAAGLLAVAGITSGCIIVVNSEEWDDDWDHEWHDDHNDDLTKRSWTQPIDANAINATSSLVVRSDAGDITIEPTDGPARIRAEARGPNRDRVDAVAISIVQDGDELVIEPVWPDGTTRRNESVELVIAVPVRTGVSVRTDAGDVGVADMAGALTVSTSAGDVEVDGHNGPARISSSAGDIELMHVSGAIDAETSAGDVDLFNVGWPIEAVTSAGDITVAMRHGFSGELNASTSAGQIDMPGRGSKSKMGAMQSASHTLGDGSSDAECRFATSAGDIDIRVLPQDG